MSQQTCLTETMPAVSFEFFPTKTDEGARKLLEHASKLAITNPEFFSVTYGAGGSTRDRTHNIVTQLKQETGVNATPHLACIGDTKENICRLLNIYKNEGINRLVALRGDLPSGMGRYTDGELQYASELVTLIREETGDHFHLEVAAYPEAHPQAPNLDADIQNFKRKVEAGANSAITQYFFNTDSYFYFLDRIRDMGIDIPIVPGIMPITNYTKLARFSDACGAELPRWIRKQLDAYGDDAASIRKFGEEVTTRMCEKLIAAGVPSLHFYTLNQSAPSLAVTRNLGLHQ